MSLMRKALLAGSTNVWLRERATKAAFVRRSVARFMPGETMDDALRAAGELKGERITTILTRLGACSRTRGSSTSRAARPRPQ